MSSHHPAKSRALPRPNRLRRELGLLEAVGVGLGAVIGAGIFVVTGVAARHAGPSLLVSLAIAGAAAACNAYSAAQLAIVFPRAGGAYEFGRRLIHPAAGFAAGWLFTISKIAAGGAVALGFGLYLHEAVPRIDERTGGVAAVLLLTGANLAGVRKSGLLNTFIVAVTSAILLVFAFRCLPQIRSDHFLPFFPGGVEGTLRGAALFFFAYTGYARVATLCEEVRDPRRTIPRAILLTVLGALLLYLLVGFAAVGAVGAAALSTARSPLAHAAGQVAAGWLPPLVIIAAVTAMLGVLLSQILGVSRTLYAMGRKRDFPAFLGRTGGKRGIPTAAVVCTGAAVAAVTALGGVAGTVSLASFAILAYYAVMNTAALRLSLRRRRKTVRWIPVCGLAFCFLLLFSLPLRVIGQGTALVTLGLGFWFVVKKLTHSKN